MDQPRKHKNIQQIINEENIFFVYLFKMNQNFLFCTYSLDFVDLDDLWILWHTTLTYVLLLIKNYFFTG